MADLIDTSNANHPAKRFISEAESHVGEGGHEWVQSMVPIGTQPWCAATCCAVAKACGFAGINMPGDNFMAAGFGQSVVEDYGGTYIAGPLQGNPDAVPQTGDLVLYQHSGYSEFEAYHIGMVRYCEGDTVYTVEGNTTGGTYSFREKDRTGSNIGWYARPDWTKVGGSAIVGGGGGGTPMFGGLLYTSESTRADAAFREICYFSVSGKPSISPTNVRLSVINYTAFLSEYVKMFGGIAGSPDNIDGLPPIPREIVQFLTSKGLCTAAAIGVIACIKQESGFDTAAVGDHGTSFGICQWHYSRGDAMKQMAGSNWDSNLTGQLEYLWYELNTPYYESIFTILKQVPNTLEGAKIAADKFTRLYEVPDNMDQKSLERQGFAEEYWNMIVVVSQNNDGPTGSVAQAQGKITNRAGQTITSGTEVVVPDSVPQTGIIANYTSYTQFYGRWTSGTVQRELSDIWGSQGKPNSYSVATLSGYYLIAMAPVFGNAGDIVSVVLEDDTYFNAILGDIKGTDAGSEWGHYFGSSVDIVEWEAYGTDQDTLRQGLSEAGWLGKRVKRVVNYGSWL